VTSWSYLNDSGLSVVIRLGNNVMLQLSFHHFSLSDAFA